MLSSLKNGALKDVTTGNVVNPSNWKWGDLWIRVGSARSADGAVFQLDHKDKVAKFIFSAGPQAESEIMIGKMLGDAGIGPKIYASYVSSMSKNRVNKLETDMKDLGVNLNGKINIFQNYAKRPLSSKFNGKNGFDRMYIIIMERLEGFTLNQVLRGVSGTENIRVSQKEFISLVHKMHKLGVIHGDMHLNNIFVQVSKNGHTKLKIIDFGRSILNSSSKGGFKNPISANEYLRRIANKWSNGSVKNLNFINTLNGKPSHLYVGVSRYRNSAALNNTVREIEIKYGLPLNKKLKLKFQQAKKKLPTENNIRALKYKIKFKAQNMKNKLMKK
jgi:serine/threonine protein kinase